MSVLGKHGKAVLFWVVVILLIATLSIINGPTNECTTWGDGSTCQFD